MNDPKTMAVFGKLISGRAGYVPVQERRQEQLLCSGCKIPLTGDEKFCPECGTKVVKQEQKQEQ
jgi:rRNA maturation endonuclease Nob1